MPLRMVFALGSLALVLALAEAQRVSSTDSTSSSTITTWHVVWTGGQSNSVGTNSQKSGYPIWPTSARIQNFCWSGRGCKAGTFSPARVPLYNELNVGFSQTFANLLLPTLPESHGIILLNTGVGGTGFSDGNWVPDGRLTKQSIAAVQKLKAALPTTIGGNYSFHTMLWHQGEEDAADNRQHYSATYCKYLQADMGMLIDHLRSNFPGASPGTPFIDGGMLPYWVDAVNGTAGVMDAICAHEPIIYLSSTLPTSFRFIRGCRSLYGLRADRCCEYITPLYRDG